MGGAYSSAWSGKSSAWSESSTWSELQIQPWTTLGVQLSVVRKKLNVVADVGRRKLSVVTDGTPEKGRRYSTFTHTERASEATIYLSDYMH